MTPSWSASSRNSWPTSEPSSRAGWHAALFGESQSANCQVESISLEQLSGCFCQLARLVVARPLNENERQLTVASQRPILELFGVRLSLFPAPESGWLVGQSRPNITICMVTLAHRVAAAGANKTSTAAGHLNTLLISKLEFQQQRDSTSPCPRFAAASIWMTFGCAGHCGRPTLQWTGK